MKANGKVAPKRLTAVKSIWKTVLDCAKNEKYGPPEDPTNGYNFDIETKKERGFRNYTVLPERGNDPLSEEEVESIQDGFNLQELRPFTNETDMSDVFKNAKAPYDEIYNIMQDPEGYEIKTYGVDERQVIAPAVDKKKAKPGTSIATEVEEPEEEAASEPAPKLGKASTPKEEVKKKIDTVEVEEPDEEEVAYAQEEVDEETDDGEDDGAVDVNNINLYTCKGEFERDDEDCKDCPVQSICIDFQPNLRRAGEINRRVEGGELAAEHMIDISTKASVTSIVKRVKEVEEAIRPAPTPVAGKSLGKKGRKDIPF